MTRTDVLVVGAGVAGVSAAAAAAATGARVHLLDQGRQPGGRLGLRQLPDGRVVDTGAAYLTVRSPEFTGHVRGWQQAGLIVEWTDRVDVIDRAGWHTGLPGPMRWAAPAGLRCLATHDVTSLGRAGVTAEAGAAVRSVVPTVDGVTVDWTDLATGEGRTEDVAGVVLAMPAPQAQRLLAERVPGPGYEPVLSVWAAYPDRRWRAFPAAFVNDHPVLGFLADDGSRRGDDAPVLVAHTTAAFAGTYLPGPAGTAPDPGEAIEPVLAAVAEILGGTGEPTATGVMRWGLARPVGGRPEPFGWCGPRIVTCGDAWHVLAGERPRVESAWLSGRAAGGSLARVSDGAGEDRR